MSVFNLKERFPIQNFVDLHNAWQSVLSVKELGKRFYRELSVWYFWAIQKVEFPKDVHEDRDVRNSLSVIRMLTRLIFVWFLKEKRLENEKEFISEDLFREEFLKSVLNRFMQKDGSLTVYYRAILQNLFFATLNTEMDSKRSFRVTNGVDAKDKDYMVHTLYRYEKEFKDSQSILKIFREIPFLNGGLFECLDKRKDETGKGSKEIRIDCFTDHPKTQKQIHIPDELFFGHEIEVDLSGIYGDTKRKKEKVKGIIHTLRQYKFTVTENTPIEEEIALDPELLGKVFENLLASFNPETKTTARKQTGSFYTPREIVNYMVDESLTAYLENHLTPGPSLRQAQDIAPNERGKALPSGEGLVGVNHKLRHLLSHSTEDHLFTEEEVQNLIQAIHKLKILDPACGSGAFPMGVLHKLVYILHKLDPKNEEWKRLQLNQAEKIPDVNIRKHVKKEIEEAFNEKNNYQDYGRKLFLIKNCIYGVDIQTIAIEISKLRFFISLIIDQKASKDQKDNYGIVPLPNLETNFVAANTLIALEKPEGLLIGNTLKKLENELSEIRKKHFDARTYKEKKELREKDKEKRKEISEFLLKNQFSKDSASKIADWNPYDRLRAADWFDPEHMFGVFPPTPASGGGRESSPRPSTSSGNRGDEGFDIVIGNPPYVSLSHLDKKVNNELQKQNYLTFSKGSDLYFLFYELGINVLKTNAILSFISSNRFCFTNYGIDLRKYLSNQNIIELININEINIFESANVGSIISIIKKSKPNKQPISIYEVKDSFNKIYKNKKFISKKFYQENQWSFDENDSQNIKHKIESKSIPFINWKDISINRGVTTGSNKIFIISENKRREFINKDPNCKKILLPILKGANIKKYYIVKSSEYLIFSYTGIKIKNYPAVYQYLKENKKDLMEVYEAKHGQKNWYELRKCNYYDNFSQKKLVWSRLSSENAFSISKNGEFTVDSSSFAISNDIEYLASVLNSKIILFYFKLGSVIWGKDGIKWFGNYFDNIPIPEISQDEQKPFIELVDKILAAKDPSTGSGDGHLADTSKWENQIDAMVFHLYGLTEEEMLTVLDSFPKMSDLEKLKIQNFYRDIENKTFKIG